jgi:GNAT superfamily N-acetyltransferase
MGCRELGILDRGPPSSLGSLLRSARVSPMSLSIRLTEVVDKPLHDAICEPLNAYNAAKVGADDFRRLVLEDDEGRVAGGLWGHTSYAWLFVQYLFVPEAFRGTGIGTLLMARAEREAVSRGCHSAWLGTFEFQARGFYERLGYVAFGQLPDCPPGFSHFLMKKALVP